MKIDRKDLKNSEAEVVVELSVEEMAPYIEKAAKKVSETVKIEGFRPGHVPMDILKQNVGEMAILEEAAHIAIHKLIDKIIEEDISDRHVIGQPTIEVSKLAPNNPMEFKMHLTFLPTMTLGEYKNLGIKQDEVVIDEKEMKKGMDSISEMRAKETISAEAAKDGDKAILSIEMFLDGVPVENGQIPEATILLGKDYLVPGFDKHIIGAKKDAELVFALPYPAEHHHAMLAGKMVDFKVKVKEVYSREIPVLDDTIAKEFGFKDMGDMEKFMRDTLVKQEQEKMEQKSEIKMLDKILANSTFGDLPEMLIQNESELMMSELKQNLEQQGGKFEDYLSSIKKTREQLVMDFLPQAIKRVKGSLLLREIAEVEKLVITPEDIEAKIEELKHQYHGDEKIQAMVQEHGYRHYLANILANQKVIKKLREWNIA
ncbi:MAG: trigger factor [Candidatus Falkowbacteria bacterium]